VVAVVLVVVVVGGGGVVVVVVVRRHRPLRLPPPLKDTPLNDQMSLPCRHHSMG